MNDIKCETLLIEEKKQICRIRLNRPEVRNALNPKMISELRQVFEIVGRTPTIRVVMLTGEGAGFCSGADLNWMQASAAMTREENIADARQLFDLFTQIDRIRCPVVGGVEGFVIGGGVGLIGACDYVVSSKRTKFSLSEVKLGIIPAIVGPFLVKKIGMSWCRALFLSGEKFGSEKALKVGLIHEVVDSDLDLAAALSRVCNNIRDASPAAVKRAKGFLNELWAAPESERGQLAVETLADLRASPEGQEGMMAFLEKRAPTWI
jgi:methylglutaconyl-CoA hydratase